MVFLIKAVQLLLSLSLLVFVHELGHFLSARLFKMRVNKFYLFFNPWFTPFKYKPKGSETEYGLGWLPLGGYCQIAGMIDETTNSKELESPAEPWEFRAKPAWQRLLVMLGGVIFNLILAALIYIGVAKGWGDAKLPMQNVGYNITYSEVGHRMGLKNGDLPLSVDGKPITYFDKSLLPAIAEGQTLVVDRQGEVVEIEVPSDLMRALIASEQPLYQLQVPAQVGEVIENTSAAKIGLKPGDRIVAVNGEVQDQKEQVFASLARLRGDSATLTILRNGQRYELSAYLDTERGLGILFASPADVFGVEQIDYSWLEAVPAGINRAYGSLDSYVSSLKYVATKEGASQLGGIGTIGSLFPSHFSWFDFWNMTAFLSIILAVMNLLPIPGLDGGHVILLILEMITRRKLPLKVQERIQMAGMFFLILLMLYANINDIRRFFF